MREPGIGLRRNCMEKADTIMIRETKRTQALVLLLAASVVLGLSGCRVHVDRDSTGKDKNVQVDTPFGGVHVNTDQTSAADQGLPVYPGSELAKNDGNHKSADVHLGFGEWQLRIKTASYESSDSQDKVAAFYKKALARYGDVITCQGNSPVGTPTITREGLSCADDKSDAKVQMDEYKGHMELKAGSKHHQHIVGFQDPKAEKTRFSMVALDLPANLGNDDGKNE